MTEDVGTNRPGNIRRGLSRERRRGQAGGVSMAVLVHQLRASDRREAEWRVEAGTRRCGLLAMVDVGRRREEGVLKVLDDGCTASFLWRRMDSIEGL